MWKPFINWGAAVFGAAIGVTKLVEETKNVYTKANERGWFNGIRNVATDVSNWVSTRKFNGIRSVATDVSNWVSTRKFWK